MARYKTRRLISVVARPNKILELFKRKQQRIKQLLKQRRFLSDSFHSLLEENTHLKLRNMNFAKSLEEERTKVSALISDKVSMQSAYQELLIKCRTQKTELQQLYQKFESIDLARDDALNYLVKLSESMSTLTITTQKVLREIRCNNESEYKKNSNSEPIILTPRGEKQVRNRQVVINPMVQGCSIRKPKVNLCRVTIPNNDVETTNRDNLLLLPGVERAQMFSNLNIPSPVIEEEPGEMLNEAIASPPNKQKSGLGRIRLGSRERNNMEIDNTSNNVEQPCHSTRSNQRIENIVPVVEIVVQQKCSVPNACCTNTCLQDLQTQHKTVDVRSPKIILDRLNVKMENGLSVNSKLAQSRRNIEDALEGPSWLYTTSSSNECRSDDNRQQKWHNIPGQRSVDILSTEQQSSKNRNEINQTTSDYRLLSSLSIAAKKNEISETWHYNGNCDSNSENDNENNDVNNSTVIYSGKRGSTFSEPKTLKRNINHINTRKIERTLDKSPVNSTDINTTVHSISRQNINMSDTDKSNNAINDNEDPVNYEFVVPQTNSTTKMLDDALKHQNYRNENQPSCVDSETEQASRNFASDNDSSIKSKSRKQLVGSKKKSGKVQKQNKISSCKMETETTRRDLLSQSGSDEENILGEREVSQSHNISHVSSCTDEVTSAVKSITIRRRKKSLAKNFSNKVEKNVSTSGRSFKNSQETTFASAGNYTNENEALSSSVSSTTRPRRAACKNKQYTEPNLIVKLRR